MGLRPRHPPRRPGARSGPPRLGRQHHHTYLTRLADKGFLSARRLGRSNRYTPLVSREDYLSFDSRSVLSRLYGSSPRNFVAALARDGLAPGEVDELRALLDELERGAK